MEIKMTGK